MANHHPLMSTTVSRQRTPGASRSRAAATANKPARRQVPADFRRRAEVFKALSNANRLLILDALSRGERCVAELTERAGLDMSTVSNHLAVLRNVGLVRDDRRGTHVFYRLSHPCVTNLFCCMDDFQAAPADD